eukprot:7221760-Pyramimonas_sp.AAC.1
MQKKVREGNRIARGCHRLLCPSSAAQDLCVSRAPAHFSVVAHPRNQSPGSPSWGQPCRIRSVSMRSPM